MDEQPVVQENTTYEGYPVDVTREEFIDCQLLQARLMGPLRLRGFMATVCLMLTAMLLALVAVDVTAGYPMDWQTLVMGLVMLAWSLFLLVLIPPLMKRRAGKQYDHVQALGISFGGRLHIYGDRLERVGKTGTVAVSLDTGTFFIEDTRMMVFLNRSRGTLMAFPARCMTEEMATALRQAADRLPVRNRRFVARIQPQGQPVDEVTVTPTVLWQSQVDYTQEEYLDLTLEGISRRYWQTAPPMAVLGALVGVLVGMGRDTMWPSVSLFLAWFGMMTVFNLVLPRSQAKRQIPLLPRRDMTVQMRVTDRGVDMLLGTRGRVGMLWTQVQHVYDNDKAACVEICGKRQFIRIPKRCVENLAEFDEIVTNCRLKSKQ